MPSKIIVTGSLDGHFSVVFEKLAKLQAKNTFSFAIVAGDFFADPSQATPENEESLSSLLNGTIKVPLPTYFTIRQYVLPPQVIERLEGTTGEVCPNLYFLGKRSTTKTSEGIRIVALGGFPDPNITAGLSKERFLPFHTEGDAKSLYGTNSADILVTSNWPASVRRGSSILSAEGVEDPAAEQCIADLCATLKPRYHFSSSPNTFYEREPFFHQPTESQPDSHSITRFISLASAKSPSKAKWLYAFNLDPNASQPLGIPSGATASPLLHNARKRPYHGEQDGAYSRFSKHDSHHRNSKRSRQPPPGPGECFFCLSNPHLATHLITSIATDTYLTTAKGPLCTASTFPALECPAHILIIPLAHSPTLATISEPEARATTYSEMQQYRQALHAMLVDRAKGELGAVTWEVSRAGGVHVHWQFLPVSAALIDKGLVEAAFKVEAENEKYPVFKRKNIGDGASEEGDYFRVWIWRPGEDHSTDVQAQLNDTLNEKDGKVEEKEKSLVLPLSASFRFDVQFGRRVMAKLLGLETRFHWQDCGQEVAEETADAEAFKKVFKKFDFSLEDQ